MGVETTQHTGIGGTLFKLYTKYVSEPESTKHVYGYTLLVVGYLLAMGGIGLYLLGPSEGNSAMAYLVQEIAITPAAIGLVATLLGIVLMLPVRRRGTILAIFGALLCLVAIGWFTVAYPNDWSQGASYSDQIIPIYTTGLALVAGVVVMVPVVTGERSYFSETTAGHEYDHPDIMIGETDRGGLFAVFKRGTEWTWRLIDQSAVASSTEEFLSRIEAEDRVDAVKEQVAAAGLLEIKHAAFRLYESGSDAWQWYLMHEDGSVLAEGGRDFDSRDGAEDSINAMKDHGADADVFVLDRAGYDCFQENGEWGWRLMDEDRTTLARGAETYSAHGSAVDGIEEFRALTADATDLVIESYGVELVPQDDEWAWRLRDSGHQNMAVSAGAYESKGVAEDAVYDLLADIPDASIVEAGEPTYDVFDRNGEWGWRLVDDGAAVATGHGDSRGQSDATGQAEQMRAHAAAADVVEIEDLDFETYERGGSWHWRLVSSDREVRAKSTERYDTEEEAAANVDRVREEAPDADLIEFDNAAFQVYEAEEGAWRWRLIDEDGNVLSDSGQGEYESKDGAMGAMTTLKEHAPDAEHLEIENTAFEIFQDDEGWGWRLVDDIGDTIAEGGDRHETEEGARNSMDSLVTTVQEADKRAMGAGIFQVYADADDEWWWRFVLPDGTTIADAPESFGTRHAAEDAIEGIQAIADTAAVETIGDLAILLQPEDWHWELVDHDREQIAVGALQYEDRDAVTEVVEDLQRNASETTVYEIRQAAFDCYRSDDGWTWRLIDADHEVVATSPSTFDSLADAEDDAATARELGMEAELVDYDDVAFELFQDEDGWTWRFIDEHQRVIAKGAGRHESRSAAEAELDDVRAHIAEASVIEIDSAAFEFHQGDDGWRWRLVDESGSELAESIATFPTRAEAQEELSVVKEYGPESEISIAE
ncbi:Uncharacterized conserved protein YegP, UPF0339 family [Halomicrobium zhouii]|uniref:Uncharacterized conserved protein YegP, UPF0339 family n=1 Tax=Halomicrobium zhouii TaxID=767519 RepID=A0A1I6LZI1_9EURY|nr:DUF1508 domain-containing protein [Halomicrobium zhouii]SFS08857.1 Uncharacterized conserved protein YegP, UPF0339 family [Halomicrobium zhouii]